jgi:polyisoprenoid-binding protein YceI
VAETADRQFTRTLRASKSRHPEIGFSIRRTPTSCSSRDTPCSRGFGGIFNSFEGTIHVAERPQDSWVELTIDASSITTDNDTRDNHLRSGDFLDLENHPTITFRSSEVEVMSEDRLRVTGDLTVRGVTKEVVLDTEYVGMAKDGYGRTRVAFSARTEVDRDQFGVSGIWPWTPAECWWARRSRSSWRSRPFQKRS